MDVEVWPSEESALYFNRKSHNIKTSYKPEIVFQITCRSCDWRVKNLSYAHILTTILYPKGLILYHKAL